VRTPTAGRHVVAVVRSPGVVGDIPLFCGETMPFDALVDVSCVLLETPADRFLALLRADPDLSIRWTSSVAKRLDETQRRMIALLTGDLQSQLAALLLEERTPNSTDGWAVHMSQDTMAQLLGVRRQSLSRVIGGLRAQGLVSTRYRALVLRDLHRLADIAGESLERIPCPGAMTALPGRPPDPTTGGSRARDQARGYSL
jgi:CRP-like cAMP-binding protein